MTTIGILTLLVPVAALANITGTQTLTTGGSTTLDLDTGVAGMGTSGGDILWTGSSISMQGHATSYNYTAASGTQAYNLAVVNQNDLVEFGNGNFSSAPLPLSALAPAHGPRGYDHDRRPKWNAGGDADR